jgi:hypothetical protein
MPDPKPENSELLQVRIRIFVATANGDGGFLAATGALPALSVDGLRCGVEPICRVLTEHGVPIAPSTYYDARKRAGRVHAVDLREEKLMLAIARVHRDTPQHRRHHGHRRRDEEHGARRIVAALQRHRSTPGRILRADPHGALNRSGITLHRCLAYSKHALPAAQRPHPTSVGLLDTHRSQDRTSLAKGPADASVPMSVAGFIAHLRILRNHHFPYTPRG